MWRWTILTSLPEFGFTGFAENERANTATTVGRWKQLTFIFGTYSQWNDFCSQWLWQRRRLTYCQNDFCRLHPLPLWMEIATASHDFSQKLTRDALKGLTCCQIVSTISFKTIFNKFRSPSQGRKVRGGVEINPQRRRIVKSNGNFLLSGLPFLSGILPAISAVRLQRHLLLCQGWLVPGQLCAQITSSQSSEMQ